MHYVDIAAGAALTVTPTGRIELLVLDGNLTEVGDQLGKGAWLRLPDGASLSAAACPEGAKVWIKTGHLCYAKPSLG